MVLWWVPFAIFAAVFVIMALIMPTGKQQNAKAAELEDFNFPRTEDGAPIYWASGGVRIKSPNTLWYGDLKAVPIKEKVSQGLFSSTKVTVGYDYHVGMHLGWCLGGDVAVTWKALWFGDIEVWSGSLSGDEVTINVDAPDAFGGKKNGGGVSGTIRAYGGTFTQPVNSYLEGRHGAGNVPAYRGLAHMVCEQISVGEAPNVRPVSAEVLIERNGLGFGFIPGTSDVNPAEEIYAVITSEWGMAGLPTSSVNAASFNAAAQTLEDEGIGISAVLYRETDCIDHIRQILEIIDGLLYEEPTTGELHLVLIRNDYDIDTLEVFDATDYKEIKSYKTGLWTDTANTVRVIFQDRNEKYTNRTATAQDLSNITFQGRIVAAPYRMPFVKEPSVANKIASRELNFLSIPRVGLSAAFNRSISDKRPGDVIKMSILEAGIEEIVLRVMNFNLGDLGNNEVIVDLTQDKYAVSHVVFADPPGSQFVDPGVVPIEATVRQVLELPRFLGNLIVEAGETNGTDPDESFVGYLAVKPSGNEIDFNAEASDDSGANYFTDHANADFSESAQIETAVLISEAEYDTVTGIRIKNLTSSSVLYAASASEVAAGVNLVLINNEIIAYETFTDVGGGVYRLNNVWRGILDTSPRAHAVDDRVWFLTAQELDCFGLTNFVGGEDLDIQFLTNTGFSVLNSATVDSLQLQNRPERALPPDGLTVDSVAHPSTVTVDPIPLAWLRRDRLKSAITRPDAADETPEATTEYILRWRVDGGSWSEVNMGSVASYNWSHGLTTGTIDIEIYGQRDANTGLRSLLPVTRTFTLSV